MFPSLELSLQGVLLVEHVALKLDEVRSIFAFDTLASELIEIYLVLGPQGFIKICCKNEKQVRSLSDFRSKLCLRQCVCT